MSFGGKPAFLFANRSAFLENLPCRPKVSTRGDTYFAEFFMCQGPEAIGQTGDNSYNTLFGRTWGLLFCEDFGLLFLRWDDLAQAWNAVTENIPPVPAMDGSERRFSLCFDQSARAIFAYEKAGVVKVTRWDFATSTYKQNVSFSGVDPVLAMDATFRYDVGGSDVLIFYLAPDRTGIRYRLQRDVYGVDNPLPVATAMDLSGGAILDRALALPYRYELLLSDAAGDPKANAYVSELYPVPGAQALTGALYPTRGQHASSLIAVTPAPLTLQGSFAPRRGAVKDATTQFNAPANTFWGAITPRRGRSTDSTVKHTAQALALSGTVAPNKGKSEHTATNVAAPTRTLQGAVSAARGAYRRTA